jgi:hypothetical protein
LIEDCNKQRIRKAKTEKPMGKKSAELKVKRKELRQSFQEVSADAAGKLIIFTRSPTERRDRK